MDSKSFDDALRAFCRRVPFQFFAVELSNGTRFEVDSSVRLIDAEDPLQWVA